MHGSGLMSVTQRKGSKGKAYMGTPNDRSIDMPTGAPLELRVAKRDIWLEYLFIQCGFSKVRVFAKSMTTIARW